mgnify:FL=1
MKNLSMLFSLLVIFAVQVDAAPSKAEAEVSKAFTEYFQARQKQDYKTVVGLESASGTMNTNSDGSFHKPLNKQSEADWKASTLGGALTTYHPDFTQLSDDVVHVRFYYEGVIETPSVTRDYRTRASMNWVNEDGKWVAKTMHFSAASFGDVTVTQASDFED